MKRKIFSAVLTSVVISVIAAAIPLFIATAFEFDFLTDTVLIVSALLLSLVSGASCAAFFTKKIIRPIDELDLDRPDLGKSYGEIDDLIHKISRQNALIDRQMADLRRRQVEFTAITSNMSEGIVILDNKSEILSYNNAAKTLLGAGNVRDGEHFISLNRSRAFVSAVSAAFEGGHGEGRLGMGHKVYQIYANPVKVEEELSGVVVVIIDITEKEKREEMRREFTSNVSHELKTPLTTISGISELFMSGMVAEEDVKRFAESIHDESARLLELINDIIKLSRLDETVSPELPDSVDLAEIADEVRTRLALPAAEREVDIFLETSSAEVMGNRAILTEMIYNLTDNAIKYNKEGGRVVIKTVSENDGVLLSVSDTGIGIPPEHIDRIFERFYRVDKSHSRAIGGTGLGLSIVKHSAEFHGAALSVNSRENEGTEISVRFPKKQ